MYFELKIRLRSQRHLKNFLKNIRVISEVAWNFWAS